MSRPPYRLTLWDRLFPPSYRPYPWYMPDAVGLWLDRADDRRRYPRPGLRGLVERARDRLVELLGATLVSLALILVAGLLVLAISVAVRP